jgi:hypothetical protein
VDGHHHVPAREILVARDEPFGWDDLDPARKNLNK